MNIIDQRKQLILRIFWQRNISGVPCNFGFLIGCFLATMIFLDMESLPETSPSKFPDSGKGDLFCPYQLHLPCCPDAKITQNRKTYIEKHPSGACGSLNSIFIYDKNFKDPLFAKKIIWICDKSSHDLSERVITRNLVISNEDGRLEGTSWNYASAIGRDQPTWRDGLRGYFNDEKRAS